MSAARRGLGGIALGALLAGVAAPVAAQGPLTPRSLGMGGAYLGTARGHDALFLNPANLALPGNPRWSIGLPQVGVSSTLLGAEFADLPALLGGTATDGQREALLGALPESGSELQVDVRAPLASVQVGRLALGVGYGAVGQHTVGRDLVELLVNGYEEGRTRYAVGNTSGSRMTYWEAAAGLGHRIGGLSFGATGRYIRGGSAARTRMFEPRVDVERRDISIDYVSVIARGGSGFSLDLGAAFQPAPSVTVSAAVANAASSMTWSDRLRVRDFTLRSSDLDSLSFGELKARYEGSEADLDPTAVPLRVFETAQGIYDGGFFPAVASIGVDWSPATGTSVGVGYRDQLTAGRLAGRWERTASVGVQQRLPLITLRVGFASDLAERRLLSGGASLGPLELGLARLHDGLGDGAPRSGWIGTLGLSVRGEPGRR